MNARFSKIVSVLKRQQQYIPNIIGACIGGTAGYIGCKHLIVHDLRYENVPVKVLIYPTLVAGVFGGFFPTISLIGGLSWAIVWGNMKWMEYCNDELIRCNSTRRP